MKKLLTIALCVMLTSVPIVAEDTNQAISLYEAEDYDAAVPLLQEAADQGNAEAQNKLGNCYFYGWGVDQDYEEALKWYQLAADQGLEIAQFNLGSMYVL